MNEAIEIPAYLLARHPGTKPENWQQVGGGWVHNCARVGNGARVGSNATVGDGATFERSPLLIQGTRHAAYHVGPGVMGIGCIVQPIAEWRERCEAIGRAHWYSDAEIAEYREYIEMIARRDAQLFAVNKEAE